MSHENAYTRAGVNIAAGQEAVDLMKAAVRATHGPEVLASIGAFGGMYDASALKAMTSPVLVASTDGVGTKTKVAARLGQWETIGRDLVNHCINDILVQGARPLFFLDYIATAALHPQQVATVIQGIAAACTAARCALLGGETAEMPGVYLPGELDLVGTIVGVVERARVPDGSRIAPSDVLIGLPSTGLHTNGYSLARTVLADLDWTQPHPDLGCSVGEALLAVHRSYLEPVARLWNAGVDIRGLAHITGGGLIDNVPRMFPSGAPLTALFQRGSWPILPIFTLIQREGAIPDEEMFHVFNMGLGMIIVVPPEHVALAQATLHPESYVVGEIVTGETSVIINHTDELKD